MDNKFIKVETKPNQNINFKILSEDVQINKTIYKLSNKLYSFKISDNQKSIKTDFVQSIASTMAVHNFDDDAHSNIVASINKNIADTNNQVVNKVDKVNGKNLSTNDLTDDLKSNYNIAYANNHIHNNKTSIDAIPAPAVGNFLQGTASGFQNRTPEQVAGDICASKIGKNLLINGGFFVNQRVYVSGTVTTTANQYTLDRWRVVTSGQNLSFSDSNGKRTITAPAGGVEQVIEGLWLQNGTYSLSWTGTATGYVNGTVIANGGSVTLTGGSNITIKFTGGTVSNAQFELGSYATQFELRSFTQELQLCQRYFEKSYDYALAVGTIGQSYNNTMSGANGNYRSTQGFKVYKRTTPTMTLYNPGTGAIGSIRGEDNSNPTAVIGSTQSTFAVLNTAGVSINQAFYYHWTADAEL